MRTDELKRCHRLTALKWMAQRMNVPGSVEWIPDRGLVALDDDDNLVAVMTLYYDERAKIALSSWIITSPQNSCRVSYAAVALLISALPVYARKLGAEYILTNYSNKVINRLLGRKGFYAGEKTESKFLFL